MTSYTSLSNDVPTVPAADLVTSGTLQLVVRCPHCGAQHRHLGLGLRRSPCGRYYVLAHPAAQLSAA
ncbi:hypothetical protein [Streptomyces sp. PH10-H1]|uniref:hypothetical protein n=1 Tax=Streptomyces sp. PH10-H1 TaxID=3046212 RepID=UPI0024BA7C12|nr:hypothetical protein [Streptomyces sp. PH10-H1]MDJ0341783.1 hypothetical protein [Streptomyces sp. PH10-H1]